MLRSIRRYALDNNVEKALVKDVSTCHVMVDWSTKGADYALFAGHPSLRVLLGVNSHGLKRNEMSSYLGEMQGLVWVLNDIKTIVQGGPWVLWTDSEGVFSNV